MKLPDDDVRSLVAEWISKADLDFRAVVRLLPEDEFRNIVAFHAQQAVEKYLKAILTRHGVEFPKTHVIRRLLILLNGVEPALAQALDEASWLGPFGSDIRYPGDRPDTVPGDEVRAHDLARRVRQGVMAVLEPYLSGLPAN